VVQSIGDNKKFVSFDARGAACVLSICCGMAPVDSLQMIKVEARVV